MSQGFRPYSPKSESTKGDTYRVLVGMSGGIHSAVTAALLKTQGHEVLGLYIETKVPAALSRMKNHCSAGNARAEAEKAAAKLGIELHGVDASALYQVKVLDPFVHEATLGSSPNPCVSCNREVRLGTLFKKAQELQCDRVATGHGAQLLYDPRTGLYQLLQASDSGRDQSYFLFTLTQEELGRLLLPLGNFPNAMVSRLSAEYGFSMTPSLSQEICFSGSQGATSYIESRVAPSLRPQGVIRTYTQQVLGDHQGMHRIRAGEKPEVQVSAQEVEDFVAVGVDSANHAWIVGPPELLLKKDCLIFHANWLKPIHQLKGLRCQARLKPEGELLACQLTFFENQTVHIDFDQKQGPLFPGQAIVFYQDNEVLGGGWIRSTS